MCSENRQKNTHYFTSDQEDTSKQKDKTTLQPGQNTEGKSH